VPKGGGREASHWRAVSCMSSPMAGAKYVQNVSCIQPLHSLVCPSVLKEPGPLYSVAVGRRKGQIHPALPLPPPPPKLVLSMTLPAPC
jgi:hypothetical protein